VFKRTFDIVCSCVLLALTLPLLVFAAILIKLDSAGPVVFRQARAGRGFRPFALLKLRTMTLGGGGSAYTLGADPRITRVGRWLRHYKVDELPQLWNVLRGEMSMVGPRPVIPQLALEFDWAYQRLLSVRPGLTDPASLRYCNETEILSAVPEPLHYFKAVVTPAKIRISQDYLNHADLRSDLAVMAKTALALAFPAARRRFSQPVPERWDGDLRLVVLPQPAGAGKVREMTARQQPQIPAAVIEMRAHSHVAGKGGPLSA
jgi:lipopolysaccharide/colanic/teichoic acid biosynthesis glycosyltransferase